MKQLISIISLCLFIIACGGAQKTGNQADKANDNTSAAKTTVRKAENKPPNVKPPSRPAMKSVGDSKVPLPKIQREARYVDPVEAGQKLAMYYCNCERDDLPEILKKNCREQYQKMLKTQSDMFINEADRNSFKDEHKKGIANCN